MKQRRIQRLIGLPMDDVGLHERAERVFDRVIRQEDQYAGEKK